MNTLYILGCGAQKLNQIAPASQLYVGSLFRATLAHAQRFAKNDNEILILSAKHGLVRLDQNLEPYDVCLDNLPKVDRKRLVQRVKRQLPTLWPGAWNPLRIVVLASAAYVELFEFANEFAWPDGKTVPLRAPLAGLPVGKQRGYLFAHVYPTMCDVELTDIAPITSAENDRLRLAIRAAAIWWANQLMRFVPPPDPSLFADALALELWREWERVYTSKRGEWPEDVRFWVTFQNAPGGYLGNALRAIGLDECVWLKREWGDRRLNAAMGVSMNSVCVDLNGDAKVVFGS